MLRRVAPLVLIACNGTRPTAHDAAPTPSATTSSSVAAAPTPTREPETLPPPSGDGGAGLCTRLEGPVKLARPGPFAASERMGFVDFYANDAGKPALAGSLRVTARAGQPAITPPAASPATTRALPPCAAAATFAFCMNSAGEIRRYRLGPSLESDNFVARARPGGPVAAATIAGRPLVVYTRDRTTSEGVVSEAWAETDDGAETRLSEDGAGATTLALAPHGAGAIAFYVDARRGMSPVHARTMTLSPKLALGKDAVVFIGGGAESHTRIAAGARDKTALALFPIAHDLSFGLAIVKVDAEPQTDAPVVWSDYPNGLDPAPVAVTSGSPKAFVARVRPSAPKFGSPRILEIGTIDASGAFASLGVLETSGAPRDLAIAGDGASGFVLAYSAGGSGWAEHLSCESAK